MRHDITGVANPPNPRNSRLCLNYCLSDEEYTSRISRMDYSSSFHPQIVKKQEVDAVFGHIFSCILRL